MTLDIPHLMAKPGWSGGSILDPAYAKLGSLLKPAEALEKGDFAYFGVPFEGLLLNDIGGKGGPDGLRLALAKLRPYSVDLDLDFLEVNGLADLGDVEVDYMSYDITLSRTEAVMKAVLDRGLVPIVAGGSHSITEATLRAFSEFHGRNIGVVWFDAHPDLMPDYKGDRHYCGCPLRRNIESGHLRPENVAMFGLRGFANSGAEIREGRAMGMSIYSMEDFHARGIDRCIDEAIGIATRGTDAFYVTFDIDAVDHTFAPATQYPAPGGFQPLDVMRFVRKLGMAGAGAIDAVEYAPLIDPSRNTGNLLATVLCEFMAGTAWRRAAGRAEGG